MVSSWRWLISPTTMKASKAISEKLPSGLRQRADRSGHWWLTVMPATIGSASRASRLNQMPEGSMSSWRNQPAVAGLLATIQLKFNGVSTSAISAATHDTVTDSAVLPRPKCVR